MLLVALLKHHGICEITSIMFNAKIWKFIGKGNPKRSEDKKFNRSYVDDFRMKKHS